jgi:predicted small lipoprotein YifL
MTRRLATGLCVLAVVLGGCGLKGPLYLPEKSEVTIRPGPAGSAPEQPADTAAPQPPADTAAPAQSTPPASPPAEAPPQEAPPGQDRG